MSEIIKVGEFNCKRKRKEFSDSSKPFITSALEYTEKVFSTEDLALLEDHKLFTASS
jgi:hypothetical protein